jgi:hypothetical protein
MFMGERTEPLDRFYGQLRKALMRLFGRSSVLLVDKDYAGFDPRAKNRRSPSAAAGNTLDKFAFGPVDF